MKSNEEAEEIVQNLFLKIWNNRSSLDPARSFRSYLFTIAGHDISAAFKRIQRTRFYLDDITVDVAVSCNETEQQINYHSLLSLVEEIIDRLPDRQREVLLMRRMEGRSVSDIARQLNLSVKTVEHHITEALKTIRKRLNKENALLFLFLLSLKSTGHKKIIPD